MDPAIDAMLEKACSTHEGRIKATHALDDLNKVAAAYHNDSSRTAAEATLEAWSAGERGALRKGLAVAWLARARAAVAGVAQTAERKVGNVGAAAGEKLARSPLNAKRMAAAREAGGQEAQKRMLERLQPRPTGRGPTLFPPEAARSAAAPGRIAGRIETVTHRNFGAEQAAARGNASGMSLEQNRAAVHAEALRGAFKAGAESAANAHAGAAARMGRVAARHGFRAGLAIAGAGAAGAGIHAALSDKQREQRVEAGKHSHDKHAAAAGRTMMPGAAR